MSVTPMNGVFVQPWLGNRYHDSEYLFMSSYEELIEFRAWEALQEAYILGVWARSAIDITLGCWAIQRPAIRWEYPCVVTLGFTK